MPVPAPLSSSDGEGPSAEPRAHVRPSPLSVIPLPVMESDGRVVQLCGRLDASTTAELRAALGAVDREARAGDLVVLDLAGIDHADATGLAPLVLARRRARARAYVLALSAPSPAVVAVMTRTHLTGAFRIVTPRAEAVAQPA